MGPSMYKLDYLVTFILYYVFKKYTTGSIVHMLSQKWLQHTGTIVIILITLSVMTSFFCRWK